MPDTLKAIRNGRIATLATATKFWINVYFASLKATKTGSLVSPVAVS